jgi:hypothetical protein
VDVITGEVGKWESRTLPYVICAKHKQGLKARLKEWANKAYEENDEPDLGKLVKITFHKGAKLADEKAMPLEPPNDGPEEEVPGVRRESDGPAVQAEVSDVLEAEPVHGPGLHEGDG